MRKIISIVVTLGVILGLTAFAAPVAAAPCVCPAGSSPVTIVDVLLPSPPDFCAGELSDYLIGDAATEWPIPITMLGNTDSYVIEFPAGTDLSGVTPAGVLVTSANMAGTLPATSISVVGTTLYVKVPAAWVTVAPNDFIQIEVQGVVNTATPDTYCIYVGYMDDCCDVVITDCGTFTVVPNICTLDFVFDFGPTYTGIAPGFIPPFKACGQTGYGHVEAVGWVTDFDVIIDNVVPGCHPPCSAAKYFFVVDAVEPGGVITLYDVGTLTTWTLTALDIGSLADPTTHKTIVPALALPDPCAALAPFPMWVHFSTPGDYQITFYLQCPAVVCGPGSAIIADEPLPAKVHQWKDAYKIPLYRKWNLISLPLVPLEDPNAIEDVWAAYQFESDVLGVYYFDQCTDHWSVYGNGQTSLATMEDGKSYWVKIKYDFATLLPGTPMDGLWVWGTPKPVPPASPSSYEICTGWNMVGFTDSVAPFPSGGMADFNYLWNWFNAFGIPEYGTVAGWDPTIQEFWSFLPTFGWFPWFYLGEGYWISFDHDGMIYPP